MEAVRAFNNELSGLYECKPPISRAKMAQVTKTAIKAIKFYKHVVQSVEKFIQKCKPEYKVPGLYVIDSVVRQSRHQFGANKDVFSPRFIKNLVTTFQNLFKCSGDDRSKVVRVLNLWQKNGVFPSEIVQPLLDMAADPTNPSNIAAAQRAVDQLVGPSKPAVEQAPSGEGDGVAGVAADSMLATQNDMLNTVTQLLQQTDGVGGDHGQTSLSQQQQQLQQLQLLQQQLIQQTQLIQQPNQAGAPIIDSNLLAQIQTLTNQLLSKTEREAKQPDPGFNTKLLDFDYGESDDEDGGKHHRHHQQPSAADPNITGNVQTILNDASLMQQIQQMTQTIEKTEQLKSELGDQEKLRQQLLEQQQADLRQQVLQQQQAEFDEQIQSAGGQPVPPPPFGQPEYMDQEQEQEQEQQQQGYEDEGPKDEDFREQHAMKDRDDREYRDRSERRRRSRDRSHDRSSPTGEGGGGLVKNKVQSRLWNLAVDDSKEESRTPKRRRRSRSRSRDRRRKSRSRDRDRDRHRRSRSKDREREKQQREKDRERRKSGLPPLREKFIAVCTTTVWIGHLNKYTTEEEVRNELETYGPVESINMVPPRGCAYAVMTNRKDACKAMDRLKGFKLNGSALKTAWAQSTAIRESEYKEHWDMDLGALFLPWDNLPGDLTAYIDGAVIDNDSLPEHLKEIPTKKAVLEAGEDDQLMQPEESQPGPQTYMGQQPMMGQMPGMVPPMAHGMMSGMMPQMMMQMQQRPGMPPQPMAVTPGTPTQMMPGGPRPPMPGMPGIRPAVTPGTPINQLVSTAPSTTLPPAMVATSGMMPNAVAGVPRPGFPPVAQPGGYNFNPNMPPPGFRLPIRPPGFMGSPQRPLAPGMSGPDGKPGERGPAPGVAWPPDSNEMDEDEDTEESPEKGSASPRSTDGSTPDKLPPGQFGGPPPPGSFPPMPGNWPRMGAFPEGMMGGPCGGPNGMPPRGPGPDRFNGPMGMRPGFFPPGGPRFMGRPGMPGMPGGPGMMRFPPGFPGPPGLGMRPGMMGGPRMRGPVSLLDLDIKPTENFEGETFELEEGDGAGEQDLQQMYKDSDEFAEHGEEDGDDAPNQGQTNATPTRDEPEKPCYLANPWKSVANDKTKPGRSEERGSRSDRAHDKDRSSERDEEGGRDREREGGRDRDSGRDRDRDSGRDRDRGRSHRGDDSDRRERERVRQRGGHRGRDDWEGHGREDHQPHRDRGRDDTRKDRRGRSSRWSNIDDDDNMASSEANDQASVQQPDVQQPDVQQPQPDAQQPDVEMPSLECENNENVENIGNAENVQNENPESESIPHSDNNMNVTEENIQGAGENGLANDENSPGGDVNLHVNDENIQVNETGDSESTDVPLSAVDTNIAASKLEGLKPTDVTEGPLTNNTDTNDANTENVENLDLEEGEIPS